MRWLFNNFGLKLLALVMAASISAYVYYEINFPVPDTLHLPLRVEGLNDHLTVAVPLPESVEVHVRGPYRAIRQLRILGPAAQVSLQGMSEPGTRRLAVTVPDLGDVAITSLNPDSVSVTLDLLQSLQIPLQLERRGQLDSRFVIASEKWTPVSVTVSGPESVLSRIVRAQVELNLSSLNREIDAINKPVVMKLPVSLSTEDGERVIMPGAALEPEFVEYAVTLAPAGTVRVLRVLPVCEGKPPEGYMLSSVTPDPFYIPVPAGPGLDGVPVVRTEPMILSGKLESFVAEATLLYPFEVQSSSGLPLKTAVTVEIIPVLGASSGEVSLQVDTTSWTSGYEYVLQPPQVKLVSQDLAGLEAEQLRSITAKVDVANLPPGEYRIAPQLSLPTQLNNVRIVPDTVTLTVIEQGQ